MSKAKSGTWLPDGDTQCCFRCHTLFSLLNRRHHCRCCGMIYCATCSATKKVVPEVDPATEVRVCMDCDAILAGKEPQNYIPALMYKGKAKPYEPEPSEFYSGPPSANQAWSSKPNADLPIRFSRKGIASKQYGTLIDKFKTAAEKFPNHPALMIEAPQPTLPKDSVGPMITYTWSDFYKKSVAFSRALIAIGFERFNSVAICGFNHPVWHFAHMGVILLNGMSAGTYTTNSSDACQYVAEHSDARVVVVDTMANAKKYLDKRSKLPKVKFVVVYKEDIPSEVKAQHEGYLCTFDDFLLKGDSVPEEEVTKCTAQVKVTDCATLIYTSGTTGTPKAVMMSHDNVIFSCTSIIKTMTFSAPEHHIISYLPMSHIAAQIIDVFLPCLLTSDYGQPMTIHFARPDALKGSLALTLKAVRPTTFFGVPRVWEKFMESIKAKAKAEPATGMKLKIVNFAKECGITSSKARQVGGDGKFPSGEGWAKSLVHDKVRLNMGLDRCNLCLTGAAPIQRDTLEFMAALGIDIIEVYGMSECCGVTTCGAPFRFKFGSCGFPMAGCEVKLDSNPSRDKPGQGEICFRGRHIMIGYLKNDEKSRESIDPEGWLHSGDVGRFEDGMLYITGRIKELIIGAGGENIAPVPVEDEIKKHCPALSNVVMIGDKRKYNVALVAIKTKPNLETGEFTDDLMNEALEVVPGVTTLSEAKDNEAWNKYIEGGIKKYNTGPACVSNASKIQKFRILPMDLSVPGGELTATLKIKRSVVAEKYHDVIEEMFAGDDTASPA